MKIYVILNDDLSRKSVATIEKAFKDKDKAVAYKEKYGKYSRSRMWIHEVELID